MLISEIIHQGEKYLEIHILYNLRYLLNTS
jgi:hypothetical protein